MLDINNLIAYNIRQKMIEKETTVDELARYTDIPQKVLKQILLGGKLPNAVMMKKMADCLGTTTESFVKIPENYVETDPIKSMLERVNSDEAKDAIRTADTISDMILFYSRVSENAKAMMQPWEEEEL